MHESSSRHQQVETPQDELGNSQVINGSSYGSEVVSEFIQEPHTNHVPARIQKYQYNNHRKHRMQGAR